MWLKELRSVLTYYKGINTYLDIIMKISQLFRIFYNYPLSIFSIKMLVRKMC